MPHSGLEFTHSRPKISSGVSTPNRHWIEIFLSAWLGFLGLIWSATAIYRDSSSRETLGLILCWFGSAPNQEATIALGNDILLIAVGVSIVASFLGHRTVRLTLFALLVICLAAVTQMFIHSVGSPYGMPCAGSAVVGDSFTVAAAAAIQAGVIITFARTRMLSGIRSCNWTAGRWIRP